MFDPDDCLEDDLFDWPKKLAKFLKNIGAVILFLGGLSALITGIYMLDPAIIAFSVGLTLTVLLGIEQAKIWIRMIFLGEEP